MALRSVVVQPPSAAAPEGGPRRSVVVRQGPPPAGKGRATDVIAGVIGLLLLIATIGLVQILPKDEVILPQFTLFFVPQEGGTNKSIPGEVFVEISPNNVKEYAFEVPDNVFELVVRVSFTDDIAASQPDEFTIELIDPEGEVRGTMTTAINAPPLVTPASGPFSFTAQSLTARHRVGIAVVPPDEIVPAIAADETQKEALDRLAPDYLVESAGTWTARITMLDAGDCPTQDEADPSRVMGCRLEDEDGVDPGNSLAIEAFVYSQFVPCVALLDANVLATCHVA